MKIKFKNMKGLTGELLKVTLLLLSVVSMIGLNTAVSYAQQGLAIHYLATARSYTATFQMNDKAQDVWQRVVDSTKKKNPGNLEIKKEDKEKLVFEATKKTKNGETLWGKVKVTPAGENSSHVMFTATMRGGEPLPESMKDFVLGAIQRFCHEQGLTCNIDK
jgi:alkylated DNA nucleotide flippase Atl1